MRKRIVNLPATYHATPVSLQRPSHVPPSQPLRAPCLATSTPFPPRAAPSLSRRPYH
jgi:hypothetical protein